MARAQPPEESLLSRFSEFLAQQMGLHFPQERWPDLLRGMEAVAGEFRFGDIAACMQWLLSEPLSKSRIETLAGHLTIGETYFFREPLVFEALQTHILPLLIRSRSPSGKRLRLWSAACSTGEETYSLAILVQRTIPDFKQWNITILGTDINSQALRKAAAGIYGSWSFRNAPPWLLDRYFRAAGKGQYELIPQVRDMVTFSYLNLAEDVYPSLANNTNAMDVIFCRNVLMYFEPGLAAQVVRKHCRSLVDGGWLIVSPAEVSQALFAQMEAVNLPGVIVHRKKDSHSASKAAADFAVQPEFRGAAEIGLNTVDSSSFKSPHPGSFGAARDRPFDLAQDRLLPEGKGGRVLKPKAVSAKVSPPQPPSYRQAFALYRQGRYSEATEQVSRLLAEGKDKAQAMNLMVRIHANQGDLGTALHWSGQAIAADRLNPVGHYLMAVVLLEQGKPKEAMLALTRTLYLDQDFVLAHFTLGNLCRSQGRHKDAGKHFANTLALLESYSRDTVLPESEGMTAGRLVETLHTLVRQEQPV